LRRAFLSRQSDQQPELIGTLRPLARRKISFLPLELCKLLLDYALILSGSWTPKR
jgi:hypothetical protein